MKKFFSAMALTAIGFGSLYAQSTTVSGVIYNQPQAGPNIAAGPTTVLPTTDTTNLRVILIHSGSNTIATHKDVASNGTFTFSVNPGTYYAMLVSRDIPAIIGQPAPSVFLQTDWSRIGESVNPSGDRDAIIDGKTEPFTVIASTPFPDIRFGIHPRPVAHNKRNVQVDKNATSATTALSITTTPTTFTQGAPDILSGVDSNGGVITHYTISNLPKYGTLYLGSTAVSSLSAVAHLTTTEIATLGYRPNASAKSQEMDFFTYYANDNGLAKSNNATYVIPFQLLDSDGDGVPNRTDVDDDNDGITDVVECDLNSLANLSFAYTGDPLNGIPSQFTSIFPSHFGLAVAHRTGQSLSQDLSSVFGKSPGSVIVTITNANTHPTADRFYTNDSTGPSVWTVTGSLGSYVVANHGAQYFSWDTRSITRLDNGLPFQIFGQQGTSPAGSTKWLWGNDGYTWTLKSDTALRGPNPPAGPGPREGVLLGGFTDASPKYFQMASNANDLREWATYFVDILPECDLDNDGIPNRLDLDSDNDGCLDAVEGGASINVNETVEAPAGTLSSGFGSSAPNRTLCVSNGCVDATGLPTAVSALGGQAAGTTYNAGAQDPDCNIALPVSFLQFEAFKFTNVVQLDWTTATEINNRGFDIEKSTDGKSWQNIGFVNSLAQNGNSNDLKLSYQLIDNKPFSGSNLYRLKQVDFDGNFEYSEVRSINMNGNDVISIFPNPTKDQVSITGLNSNTTILVYSIDGKRMIQQKTAGNNATVSMADLSEGIYTIIIQNDNGSILSRQNIVKKK